MTSGEGRQGPGQRATGLPTPAEIPGPAPGTTRIGIRVDDAAALVRLNQRFDDFYIIGFMYGIDGTTWYAMPKEAPDEGITEDSPEHLTEVLVIDHGARQEAKRAAAEADAAASLSEAVPATSQGRAADLSSVDTAERMST